MNHVFFSACREAGLSFLRNYYITTI